MDRVPSYCEGLLAVAPLRAGAPGSQRKNVVRVCREPRSSTGRTGGKGARSPPQVREAQHGLYKEWQQTCAAHMHGPTASSTLAARRAKNQAARWAAEHAARRSWWSTPGASCSWAGGLAIYACPAVQLRVEGLVPLCHGVPTSGRVGAGTGRVSSPHGINGRRPAPSGRWWLCLTSS